MNGNRNYRKGVSVFIVTGLCLTAGFFAWRLVLARRFTAGVKTLFSLSGNFAAKKFSYAQLDGLPSPVQRYFRHVIKDGQPYINYARLPMMANSELAWTRIGQILLVSNILQPARPALSGKAKQASSLP